MPLMEYKCSYEMLCIMPHTMKPYLPFIEENVRHDVRQTPPHHQDRIIRDMGYLLAESALNCTLNQDFQRMSKEVRYAVLGFCSFKGEESC